LYSVHNFYRFVTQTTDDNCKLVWSDSVRYYYVS